MTVQGELFAVCALCNGQMWQGRGRLVFTSCPDGRALLRLEDGTHRGNWLELLPGDVTWLLAALTAHAARGIEDERG